MAGREAPPPTTGTRWALWIPPVGSPAITRGSVLSWLPPPSSEARRHWQSSALSANPDSMEGQGDFPACKPESTFDIELSPRGTDDHDSSRIQTTDQTDSVSGVYTYMSMFM